MRTAYRTIEGGVPDLPRALLLDLDDTILDDTSSVTDCWRAACDAHAVDGITARALFDAVQTSSEEYWSDPERHRVGRLDLPKARHEVVSRAFRSLGIDAVDVALRISTAYATARHERIRPFDDAVDTVRWFRERGCRLALLTNGAHDAQRTKIERFELEGLFDAVLIEGALGYGKPDPRVYRHALDALGVSPSESWMVGDNLEWDVGGPQKLGIVGIWIDARGAGIPAGSAVRPDRIIRSLSELKS
jgi:putative hydrolase of the HAD superfamily